MKVFVFLVGVKYEEVMKQRPHHMADYLATKGHKVLYIGYDAKRTVLKKEEFKNLFTIKEETEYYSEVKANLFTLPFIERVEKGNKVGMDEVLSKIELFYGSENTIFYAGHPVWMKYLGKLSEHTKIIYDCMDDWEQFVLDLGFGEKHYIYDERKLAGVSNIVITSAKKLYCRMYYYSNNIYYMPNGVKSQDYLSSQYIPEDLKKMEGPIVFFMGTITGWVDLKLIDYIAEKRKEYCFVYVGDIVEVKKGEVPRRDNIFYLGKKKYLELVNYLKQSRVAIIPFKENRLTASVSPLKFYEYISAGVPVVSTMLPDLLGISGASIASNSSDFLKAIDYYVKMSEADYKELQSELFKASAQFEWGNMMENLLLYMENEVDGEKSKRDFINNAINYYKDFSENDLIKNELLIMYNITERYEEAVKIGEELENNNKSFDFEQLALAYCKTGRFQGAIKYLNAFISINKHYYIHQNYIDNILKHEKCNQLLEAFLLKTCYRYYEAISLCESIIDEKAADPFIYAMLSSLYYEIGEYEISAVLIPTIVDYMSSIGFEKIFSPDHLANMVDFFIKEGLYNIAEDIGLALLGMGLEDMATKKLGEIYFSKAFINAN